MASKTAVPCTVLLLRLVTLALLAASLAIIATDKYTDNIFADDVPRKYTFKDTYAYRYVLAVAVIGCAYTLVQIPFAAVSIARGKRVVGGGSENVALLLVFTDVVAALLLATGAAAGFGYTYDVKRWYDRLFTTQPAEAYEDWPELGQQYHEMDRFFNLAFTSSGLMLGAAACVAFTIMVSVHSLVKG